MNKYYFKNILIVKHGSLGDIAFSILAMDSIRKYFDDSKIDLLTDNKYKNFLKKSRYFHSIIEDRREGFFNSLKVILEIKKIIMI